MKVQKAVFGAIAPSNVVFLSKKKEEGKKQKPDNMPSNPNKENPDDRLWRALLAISGIKGYDSKLTDSDKNEILNTLETGNYRVKPASAAPIYSSYESIYTINPTISKYTAEYGGIPLLTQKNALNKDSIKYEKAIKDIQEMGYKKLAVKEKLPEIKSDNPVIWSVTSEFAPVKEGGLGSVPVQIRNNMEQLGISVPTFIPMYLNEGHSTFSEENGKYRYNYKGKEFELEKAVSFKLDTYKNSRQENATVNIFLHTDKDENNIERQLVFIKCDGYFDGTIYEANAKTEEPEKFAIMSKAVYELAKIKLDGIKASKDVKIASIKALDAIKAPDGMILNDWQASPTTALMRYKAGMENAYGQLSDETAYRLKNMGIITIGHNVTYQGSTQNENTKPQKTQATSNILNTLFDKYAYDIVSNAKVHTERFGDSGNSNLDNVLLINQRGEGENFTNFLNMGIILSDYFCPVSENYAKELTSNDRYDLSYNLHWALIQKADSGKMRGIINGNDFDKLSIEAKAGDIKKTTGVEFKTYGKNSSMEKVLSSRRKNKINLYNNYILPFSNSRASSKKDIKKVRELSSRLEFYEGKRGTNLPVLSEEELTETPILTSGGRLVSQKGMGVLTGAIEMLYENWEKDFPNRPKPIFYLAGQDGEGGSQRKIIEELKNEKLNKEDSNRVLFAHGFVPMPAMMAASDFFLIPSIFEPCGLTQGEAFALGTPVIASAVGGIVDTVNREGKRNGILTEPDKLPTKESFYKAMKKGLNIYFNNKDKYNNMVKDALDEDFSWVQKGKNGPVYDYLDLLGIKREKLPDIKG